MSVGMVTWVKPWWVRWLVLWVTCTGAVGLWLFAVPHLLARWSWAWGPLLVLAGAALVAGLMLILQEPSIKPFRQAVAALGPAERERAVRAVRYGPVPSDPAIRAAALRFAGVWENTRTHYRRTAFGRTAPFWSIGAFALLAIIDVVTGNRLQAIPFAVFAMSSAASWAYNRRVGRQVRVNIAALRAADPHATVDVPSLRPRRAAVTLVVLLSFGLLAASTVYLVGRPPAGCDTADALVSFIHDDATMGKVPGLPGSPGSERYRQWADRVAQYANQAPANAKVTPALHRIADLAHGVAASAGVASMPGGDRSAARAAHADHVHAVIDEEYALIAICHPKR